MELLALTAPLYIVNGEAQNAAAVPGLLAQPAPGKSARGRERDYLFVHLTLSGPAEQTAPLYDELIGLLSARYYQAGGSVTSALRRAVIELNERLLHHNLANRTSHEGAITCAVLHGGELFMLQVGEALAFLGHNFGVERQPMQPDATATTPLGRSAGIDIRFAYHVLQVGDMLLLSDPRLAFLNGTSLGPVLVDAEIEASVEELIAIIGGDTARLLLVEFTDEIPSSLPVGLSRPVAPTPAKKSSERKSKPEPAAAANPSPGPMREAGQPPIRTAAPAAGSGVGGAARAAAASSARGLSAATGWAAGVLGKPEPAEENAAPYSWALPAFLAILIPIVIGIVVTSVYLQRGNVQRVGEIKQQMVEELLLADVATEETSVRIHYQNVLNLAAEGDSLRPGDTEIGRMRMTARESLDLMDGVARLQVVVYDAFEESSRLTGISLQTGETGEAGYYALDEAGNRVLFRQTSESYDTIAEGDPAVIAFGGQAIGNQTVGPMVDIMWRPAENTDTRAGLQIIDRNGGLYIHYPNMRDNRAMVLGGGGVWQDPQSMADYSGRLYVLDSGAQQIWKYYSEGEGYIRQEADTAISFASDPDLANAVDFDLYSEDGSLIVVYRDGRIRYFNTRSGNVEWDETNLQRNGLKSPFVAPTDVAIVGRGLNASIFVLDPGSGRIVQISRGGTVLAQYRALDGAGNELLSSGNGFAVLDRPLRILITAGNQVFLATRD